MICGLLFPGLAPRPHDDTRRMPPWGWRQGLCQAGGSTTRIPHHLPGNRSCQIVGWRVFFSVPGGGFLLASPRRVGALGRGWACCLPRAPAPGLVTPDSSGPLGAPCRKPPSGLEHILKMPARRRHENKPERDPRQSARALITQTSRAPFSFFVLL